MNSEKIHKLVGIGLLTALVAVVYFLTMGITVGPFNITFALIPIVVGAALYGWAAGGWLGLVFGAMVLFTGGANAFLVINVPGTIITVLVKGAAAGLVPGLIYKALENKNRWAATICAAAAAPIVNTGIFLLGCLAFFMDTISEWAAGVGVENAGVYMVTAFVGVNFLVELGANLLLSSVIVRIVDIVKNKLSSNKQGL
ncbi:MAG: ECF transporter S component [Ruminococcaceae bacterium]|jgi:uncharacterized membrane protein|nr:ECF transporter S component [Oscillospiraceae bacterium]